MNYKSHRLHCYGFSPWVSMKMFHVSWLWFFEKSFGTFCIDMTFPQCISLNGWKDPPLLLRHRHTARLHWFRFSSWCVHNFFKIMISWVSYITQIVLASLLWWLQDYHLYWNTYHTDHIYMASSTVCSLMTYKIFKEIFFMKLVIYKQFPPLCICVLLWHSGLFYKHKF